MVVRVALPVNRTGHVVSTMARSNRPIYQLSLFRAVHYLAALREVKSCESPHVTVWTVSSGEVSVTRRGTLKLVFLKENNYRISGRASSGLEGEKISGK